MTWSFTCIGLFSILVMEQGVWSYDTQVAVKKNNKKKENKIMIIFLKNENAYIYSYKEIKSNPHKQKYLTFYQGVCWCGN